MNSINPTKYFDSMFIILWGLVFAKCLTLEYLVQIYAMPINSAVYIWSLSLIMAIVATFVFLFTKDRENSSWEKAPALWFIWGGCSLTVIILIGAVFFFAELNPYMLPAILSALLGIGHLGYGISAKKSSNALNGVGWLIGATILATQNNLKSLPILAALTILLWILPVIVKMRRQKIAFL